MLKCTNQTRKLLLSSGSLTYSLVFKPWFDALCGFLIWSGSFHGVGCLLSTFCSFHLSVAIVIELDMTMRDVLSC